MAKNFIDFEKIEKLTEQDKDISNEFRIIKLQEEVGELSAAFLKYKKISNSSASSNGSREHLLEELCDVLNVTLDLVNAFEFDDEESKIMFDKKLLKWEKKVINRV